MNDFLKGIGLGLVAAGGVGAIMFFAAIFNLIWGWFAGLIIMWLSGSYVTDGMNLIFGAERFDKSHLPLICATLAVIGGFFRSVQTNSSK